MMNSSQPLMPPSEPPRWKLPPSPFSRWLPVGLLVTSLIGFADALYLALSHYAGFSLACGVLEGCDVVTTSAYSEIFGIPISVFGGLYYITIFAGLVLYFDQKNKRLLLAVSYLTISGFLVSIGLVYIQLFILEKICVYCMGSAATSTLLFIFGMLTLRAHKRV